MLSLWCTSTIYKWKLVCCCAVHRLDIEQHMARVWFMFCEKFPTMCLFGGETVEFTCRLRTEAHKAKRIIGSQRDVLCCC